jgi:hypothetical protein
MGVLSSLLASADAEGHQILAVRAFEHHLVCISRRIPAVELHDIETGKNIVILLSGPMFFPS